RTLTALHLAHVRVDIDANSSVIASGTCEPGDYYGPALTKPPVSGAVDAGIAGTGTVCPNSGRAAGLSATDITQTDDRSGGQTRTEVPMIDDTSPTQDETVYGGFRALAGAGLPGPHGVIIPSAARVALTITRAAGGGVVLQAANVNTANGVPVRVLPAGLYNARWVLIDANGDTRTVKMRFFAA
ncbi:MAG: hypothetical protein M3Y17_03655, partial [Actinomycetota bacterium]|nr:hypothetical protein [Actinomycetota bacterium]